MCDFVKLIVSTGFLVHSMSESEKWVGVADEVRAKSEKTIKVK